MSTFVAVKQRLHPGMLDSLVRGGAQAIEIFCARGHFDYTDRAHVKEIAQWFKANPVELNSLHSPLFSDADWGRDGTPPVNLTERDKKLRIEAMDEVKRALEVAETLPFRFLVQHLGNPGESFHPGKFDSAMTAIEHLRAFAKPLGVTILVENIPNELSEPEKLLELIRTAHFDDVGVCFDIGHAHIMNTVAKDFDLLKDYIRSTHIHDNGRDRDAHLWPGEGNVDWDEGINLLRTAPRVPPLLMEIEGVEGKDTVAEMVKAFGMMEGVPTATSQ
ncbi:MAG TPA: sugar phosphate isomerase/epimerase family protein [Terriglobales bacterium]|nr:sugar phosphate isomerase/epimerase family protein [Terriglobales bacterium]